ncbi:transposase family protein [Streptomyces sp. NPDC002285]
MNTPRHRDHLRAAGPRGPGRQGVHRSRRHRHHPDPTQSPQRSGKHKASNKVHAALRAPVERTISRIKQWRILRHARISPNRLSSVSAALLTLMIYT